MKLSISQLTEEMKNTNTIDGLRDLQGKITAQTPAKSGLNFAEACDLLKTIGDKITEIRHAELGL